MYREMRRKDRLMSDAEAKRLLDEGEYGFLATVDRENQPYVIPISYTALENKIFFHCAKAGQKLDNITHESKVCFSVVGATQPIYDGDFATYYESIVVFGHADKVEDPDQKERVLIEIAKKYLPQHIAEVQEYINKLGDSTNVYSVSITQISGKERKAKK